MPYWETYHLATSLEDALQVLAASPSPSRLVAGGTDLLLDLQQGRHPPVHTLVDVTNVPEMRLLEIRGELLFVGAALPLNQLVASPLVARHALALREAAALIGGPQVRNTATLGGNVAHGLPAADGTIALLALDAQAEIANRQGCRRLALKELFLGPGRTVLDSEGDVLVGFYLPLLLPGQASAFRRVMRPQGVAIAILNVAVWVARTGTTIKDVRIAIGPGGSTPTRAYHAEEALRGKTLSSSVMSQAMDALLTEARFRTSPHRATTDYRRHLAGVLLKETFQVAWDRAARGDPD